MVSIDVDARGLATLGIADAEGEVHAYTFRPALPGLSVWAVQVVRQDTEAAYRVTLERAGHWTCDCPAMTYRKRGAEPCKHCRAAAALRAFLRQITEDPSDERQQRSRPQAG